jgi:hypothetical protein
MQGQEKCYGTTHSSMQKRCDDTYNILFDTHFGDLQVIKSNPASYFGYQLQHTVLHGTHQYDEAIEAFKTMLSKLENACDTETQSMPLNNYIL